ncbi:MAG TPA: 50S ribosomal protein L25/general stress protein Ctc [Nitratifractor sp.]|jgi:large subunit ribosomal protein L25|nr:50S ribosomal protein L25/general stress protein Ctc [Nitratifractor sp.]
MLEGIVRESIGKSDAKKLRRDGYLIANIYANGVENVHCAFKHGEFVRTVRNKKELAFDVKVGDKEMKVVVQEYQLHPVTGLILHVDLRVALADTVSDYYVPVETTGTPKGIRNKGVLVITKRRVRVRGKIEDIPSKFVLDVKDLDRDDSILIRDLEAPENCKLMDRPHVSVCGVIKAR